MWMKDVAVDHLCKRRVEYGLVECVKRNTLRGIGDTRRIKSKEFVRNNRIWVIKRVRKGEVSYLENGKMR